MLFGNQSEWLEKKVCSKGGMKMTDALCFPFRNSTENISGNRLQLQSLLVGSAGEGFRGAGELILLQVVLKHHVI